METLYFIGIQIWYGLIYLNSFFSLKAKEWINGRLNWEEDLRKGLYERDKKLLYWFHCSSLGEFEQGRPLIEQIKSNNPDSFILLTFYSPSGYNKSKNYLFADYICYMPLDTAQNAVKFLNLAKPDKVLFVKYDFWYFFLKEINNRKIPCFLTSAHFVFTGRFKFIKFLFLKKVIAFFDHIYLQDESSVKFLTQINFQNFTIAGDVRVDRVLTIAETPFEDEILNDFVLQKKVLIAGSIWDKDEQILLRWINSEMPKNWVCILVPHEISKSSILRLTQQISCEFSLYSQYIKKSKVLVIDNVGLLSRIYRYGRVAYIGGGFGKSIHNTLEPAAYGLPVIFGPRYQKFPEAVSLRKLGGGLVIHNFGEFVTAMEKLENEENWLKASAIVKSYIKNSSGATSIIERNIR